MQPTPSTVLPPNPLVPSTALPPSPLVPSTALPPSPLVPSTALPPNPLVPSTALPPSPLVPSTALPPNPLVPNTALPPIPLVPSTALPPSPLLPSLGRPAYLKFLQPVSAFVAGSLDRGQYTELSAYRGVDAQTIASKLSNTNLEKSTLVHSIDHVTGAVAELTGDTPLSTGIGADGVPNLNLLGSPSSVGTALSPDMTILELTDDPTYSCASSSSLALTVSTGGQFKVVQKAGYSFLSSKTKDNLTTSSYNTSAC